jgi:hypothetical protein
MPGLRRCPWSQIEDHVWVLYSWWRDWKSASALPWGGTDIMEQPAFVLEVIRHCEGIANTVEAEMHDKHQREVERSQRRASRGKN